MQPTVKEAISSPRSLLDSGAKLFTIQENLPPLPLFETMFFNRDYLHEDKIPDWLGGLAQIPIPEGGLVPKSYYMSSQVSDMTWLNFCLFFTFL